jgi:hypothetical protein
MLKKQLLVATLALTVVGGGLVGITHAASDATQSGQAQTTVTAVTYDGQKGNMDDGQKGNTDDGQKQ